MVSPSKFISPLGIPLAALIVSTHFLVAGEPEARLQGTAFSPVPLRTDRTAQSPLTEVFKKTEASEDPSWNTEILAERAKEQLKKLGKLVFRLSYNVGSLKCFHSSTTATELRIGLADAA
jgi:hypothetical protein